MCVALNVVYCTIPFNLISLPVKCEADMTLSLIIFQWYSTFNSITVNDCVPGNCSILVRLIISLPDHAISFTFVINHNKLVQWIYPSFILFTFSYPNWRFIFEQYEVWHQQPLTELTFGKTSAYNKVFLRGILKKEVRACCVKIS